MTFITSHLYNPESIDDPRIYFLTLVGRVIAMRELTNVILVGCLSRGCSAVGWGVRNAIETLRISDTSTKQAANLTTTVDPQGSDALDKEICSQLENAFTRMPGNLAAYMTGLQRELRTIAHAQRQKLGSSETLSTTALVNEVYLKLSTSSVRFERVEHTHFLAIAARAMRHIVINYARVLIFVSGCANPLRNLHRISSHQNCADPFRNGGFRCAKLNANGGSKFAENQQLTEPLLGAALKEPPPSIE